MQISGYSWKFLVLFLLVIHVSYGRDIIIITGETEEVQVPKESVEIFEDINKQYSYAEISDTAFRHNFTKFSATEFSHEISFFNERNSVFWLKFKIKDLTSLYKKWVLQAPLHSEYMEIYIPTGDGKIIKSTAGQSVPFPVRPYKIRALAFDLPPIKNQEYEVYLKFYSKTHLHFFFLIADQSRYTEVLGKTNYFLGIIYGVLFLMALYNFILYLSIRDRMYIYYVIYTLCSAFFISWKDGFGFQIFWPETPVLNLYHHKTGLFLLLMAFTLYAHQFLDLKKKHQRLHKVGIALSSVNVLYFLFISFDESHFDPLPIPYLLNFLFYYGMVIYYLTKGYKPSRYLILGFSFLLMALIIIKLRYMELMEWNWFVEYVLNYAVVVEAVSMSLAIRDKIVHLREEKEKAQKEKEHAQEVMIAQLKENEKLKDKVNKELEQKVRERTLELQRNMEELSVAKEKLAIAYEELGKMSVKLDLDNWDLKNKIKEERQERITSDLVSYNKFIEIFPDEFSCMKFIYNKKWGEEGANYECKRCGNHKYQELKTMKFAKKCTKCNYIETVTANTLFHRVKFEMNKAFYIAYVTSRSTSVSVTDLSKEMALRTNTCWKFKKRVEDVIESVKNRTKSQENPNWESIILES
ncbi:MAG: 7TM diverse intracellular signaling domain-containing protein [Cytophagaceae bacterium]